EHGRLHAIGTHLPKLVAAAVAQRRADLLWMALDLTVPPLALLVAVWLLAAAVDGVAAALGGSPLPLALAAPRRPALPAALFVGWAVHRRRAIPLRAFLGVPRYVMGKLSIYLAFFTGRRQRAWVRTQRDPQEEAAPAPP